MKEQVYSTIQRTGKFAKNQVRPVVTFVFNPEQAPLYYQPTSVVGQKKRGWWQRVLVIIVVVTMLGIGDWLGFGPVSQASSSASAAATTSDTTTFSDAAAPQLSSLSSAQSVAFSLNHQ